MTKFNQRERYLICTAYASEIMKLESSGDYPEKLRDQKLYKKISRWVWEVKGNITSDEGVGE